MLALLPCTVANILCTLLAFQREPIVSVLKFSAVPLQKFAAMVTSFLAHLF